MNSIEIYINSIGNNMDVFIDTINYIIRINNNEKSISREQVDELLRTIRTWNSVYPSENNKIDTEKFLIKINTNNGVDVIKGEGSYPDNYHVFKHLIGELYE